MLYALLFDGQDRLIAAAPAALQHATGDSYWRDSYAANLELTEDSQTAYVEVDDERMIQMLNSLETDDKHLSTCRLLVEAMIRQPEKPVTKSPRAA